MLRYTLYCLPWYVSKLRVASKRVLKKSERDTTTGKTFHQCVRSCKAYSTWYVQVLRSPKEAFATAMQSWRERCEKCVCLQGDYIEKLLRFQLPVVSSFF